MGRELQGPASCSPGGQEDAALFGVPCMCTGARPARGGRNRDQMPGIPELGTYPAWKGLGSPLWGVQTLSLSSADAGDWGGSWLHPAEERPSTHPQTICALGRCSVSQSGEPRVVAWGGPGWWVGLEQGAWSGRVGLEGVGGSQDLARQEGRIRKVVGPVTQEKCGLVEGGAMVVGGAGAEGRG